MDQEYPSVEAPALHSSVNQEEKEKKRKELA